MREILSENQIDPLALKFISNNHIEIVQEISNAISKNDWVVVGMAQNPLVKTAKKYLENKGQSPLYIEYGSSFSKWKERLAIKIWSGWPTFPQVFHKGKLIGGFKDLERYEF